MRLRIGLLAAVAALAAAATIAAPIAGAATPAPAVATPAPQQVVGTSDNLTYDLTATVTRFVDVGGALQAVGTLAGTVTNTATGVVTSVAGQAFTAPVSTLAMGDGTLDVSLGAAHVDALGLASVDLSPVQLSVGSNGLLDGLLAQVLGLLGGLGSQAGGLAGLLNSLLGLI